MPMPGFAGHHQRDCCDCRDCPTIISLSLEVPLMQDVETDSCNHHLSLSLYSLSLSLIRPLVSTSYIYMQTAGSRNCRSLHLLTSTSYKQGTAHIETTGSRRSHQISRIIDTHFAPQKASQKLEVTFYAVCPTFMKLTHGKIVFF